jgi:hypothetical protein
VQNVEDSTEVSSSLIPKKTEE